VAYIANKKEGHTLRIISLDMAGGKNVPGFYDTINSGRQHSIFGGRDETAFQAWGTEKPFADKLAFGSGLNNTQNI
jgi:hypothetical protein